MLVRQRRDVYYVSCEFVLRTLPGVGRALALCIRAGTRQRCCNGSALNYRTSSTMRRLRCDCWRTCAVRQLVTDNVNIVLFDRSWTQKDRLNVLFPKQTEFKGKQVEVGVLDALVRCGSEQLRVAAMVCEFHNCWTYKSSRMLSFKWNLNDGW